MYFSTRAMLYKLECRLSQVDHSYEGRFTRRFSFQASFLLEKGALVGQHGAGPLFYGGILKSGLRERRLYLAAKQREHPLDRYLEPVGVAFRPAAHI
jgi:hypothetical protein